MIVLLRNVRAPASYAGRSEKRRIQLRRKAQQPKDRRGIEIDIRAKLFLPVHHLFELLANWHPIFLARAFPEVARDLPHRRNARIAFLVNPMTEAHDLALGTQLFH